MGYDHLERFCGRIVFELLKDYLIDSVSPGSRDL